MKKIKYIIFAFLIFMITLNVKAFTFSEYQEAYQNVKNKTCTYYATNNQSENAGLFGINKFVFTFSADGLYLQTNDFSNRVIFNEGRANKDGVYLSNGSYLNFAFSEEYLNLYKKNNYSCPIQITFAEYSGMPYVVPGGVDMTNTNAVIYKTPSTNVGGKTCHYSNATSCINRKYTTYSGQDYYLEFGYYGDDNIYFGVSNSINWDQMQLKTSNIDNAEFYLLSNTGISFSIERLAAKEIWLGNQKFISPERLVIKNSSVSGGIYISGSELTNSGDDLYGKGTTGNVPENVDSNISNKDMPDLEIENVVFCSGGVLTAFKIVGYIVYVLKMIIPLVLIIMGSIDFAKAVISTNEKPNTDVIKAFTTRIVIGVIIFLIPTVLSFLINLVDGATDLFEDSEFTSCTTCLLDPMNCNDN